MSAAEMDVQLRLLLNSLTPEQLDRLKILVNARTAKMPGPPTDGPEAYRGVPVTPSLHHNWDQVEASWWRAGADAALAVTVPLVESLHYDSACSLDHHGYCQEHSHLEDGPCPDGEAQKFLAAMKKDGAS